MSEINKFKELLHHHTQTSFTCGEHRVPLEYAEFEARQQETEEALVEWVEKMEARIAELERKVSDLKTREAVIAARERQAEKFMAKVRAFIDTCNRGG